MLRLCCYTCLALALLFSQGCGKADAYNRGAKTVDSLSGAISALVKELEKTDTLLLQRSVTRFNDYREFIRQHIQDTLLKAEADNLQHFYTGGESLEQFTGNRRVLLARARLVHSQLLKLSTDIKNRALEPEPLHTFIEKEKIEAGYLMELGYEEQRRFHTGLEQFKNSLHGVDNLVRSRNRGELPTIIKDTINL